MRYPLICSNPNCTDKDVHYLDCKITEYDEKFAECYCPICGAKQERTIESMVSSYRPPADGSFYAAHPSR